jgi:hypothetical protein
MLRLASSVGAWPRKSGRPGLAKVLWMPWIDPEVRSIRSQRQVEVVLHLIAGGKPPRHGGEALQERGDRLAVRRLVQALKRRDDRRQGLFADAARDCRPFLEEGQHRFGATADASEEAGAVEVGVDALGVRTARLRAGSRRRRRRPAAAAVEPRAAGGQTLRPEAPGESRGRRIQTVLRRRWRRSRDRAYRGCRGRR